MRGTNVEKVLKKEKVLTVVLILVELNVEVTNLLLSN